MRNVWDEKPGYMDIRVFSKIILDLDRFDPKPMIILRGIWGTIIASKYPGNDRNSKETGIYG